MESYGSYLHRLLNKLGVNVSNYWCAPNTTEKIETLKHESNVLESTYDLNLYERNVQIENLSSRLVSILVDLVGRSLPVGVQVSIHEHDEKVHETSRYIPNHDLAEFKRELAMLRSNKIDDIGVEEPPKKK